MMSMNLTVRYLALLSQLPSINGQLLTVSFDMLESD
jgi:hypothetical protein